MEGNSNTTKNQVPLSRSDTLKPVFNEMPMVNPSHAPTKHSVRLWFFAGVLACALLSSACTAKTLVYPRTYIMGVRIQEFTRNLKVFIGLQDGIKGVVVQEVEPDLIGYKSGLRVGDLITHINTRPITCVRDAIMMVNASGGSADVQFVRATPQGNQRLRVQIKLMPAPKSGREMQVNSQYGQAVSRMLWDYTDDLFREVKGGMPL